MPANQPALLITDPDCGFCQRTAGWLQKRLGGNWVNSPASSEVLAAHQISQSEAQTSVWLVEFRAAAIRKSHGAAAVARVVAMHGGIWRAAALGAKPPLVWLFEPIYRLIARNRHRLPGASASCELPKTETERKSL